MCFIVVIMKILPKIRNIILNHQIKGNKATCLLFLVLFVLILAKTVALHWFLYHNLYVSDFLKTPWAFWLPKVTIALFLANVVLICPKRWASFIILLIIDFWMIANLMYFRANNSLITWESIVMATNLHGFEQSIGFYYNWQATLIWLSSLCYLLLLPWVKLSERYWQTSAGVIAIVLIGFFVGNRIHFEEKAAEVPIAPADKWKYYIPFYEPEQFRYCWLGSTYYVKQHSIIAYLPTLINNTLEEVIVKPQVVITLEEKERINLCMNDSTGEVHPKYNLVFMLVESFESFALEVKNTRGEYVLHNFRSLIDAPNGLYADKVKSQVRHGVSADGKLIVNTGILPLQEGAAAMIFPGNNYPNFAQFYERSFWSHPTPATAWNQYLMTNAYGYNKMLGGDRICIPDEEAFSWIQPTLDEIKEQSFVYFLTTINSHSPFTISPLDTNLMLPPQMPTHLQRYITCLQATDNLFGLWYEKWKTSEQAKNTVLVITGDHTVFKDAWLREFQSYAQQANLSIASGKNYCPLIIAAPQFDEPIYISEELYQMDIYPTILNLIGAKDYFWHGFGVNILDEQARSNRIFTEKEAYQLSDKIIRSNYFASK